MTGYAIIRTDRICISTHTLTWSVTFFIVSSIKSPPNFNSHAHVERDLIVANVIYTRVEISTHTLTWSVTTGVA